MIARWRKRWQRLRRDQGGAVALVTVGSLASLLGLTALAVDLGSLYLASRRLQGAADAAALAAVAVPQEAESAARRVIAANGAGNVALGIEQGSYAPDPDLAPQARFRDDAETSAARVTLAADAPIYFASLVMGKATMRMTRRATAARLDLAAFSLGSRLASVDAGVANALLSALIGSKVSLSLGDYQALLGARVDALAFADALRTGLEMEDATFGEVLAADVTLPKALQALAAALGGGNDAAAAAAVARLAAAATGGAIDLDRAIDLGRYGARATVLRGTQVRVAAFDMLRAIAELANGNRQIALDLGAGVPGIGGTRVVLALGERRADSPWLTVTDDGEPVLRTAQARIYVEAEIGAPAALLTLGATRIRLPVYVELAEAQARLRAIACPSGPASATVDLSVHPSLGHAALAEVDTARLDDFSRSPGQTPAWLLQAPLVRASGYAEAELGSDAWQTLHFTAADVAAGTPRRASSRGFAGGIVSSLAADPHIQVQGLGLGLNAGPVAGLLRTAILPLTPALDALLDNLTGLLGVGLGEADAWVNGIRCGQAALVA